MIAPLCDSCGHEQCQCAKSVEAVDRWADAVLGDSARGLAVDGAELRRAWWRRQAETLRELGKLRGSDDFTPREPMLLEDLQAVMDNE